MKSEKTEIIVRAVLLIIFLIGLIMSVGLGILGFSDSNKNPLVLIFFVIIFVVYAYGLKLSYSINKKKLDTIKIIVPLAVFMIFVTWIISITQFEYYVMEANIFGLIISVLLLIGYRRLIQKIN